MKEIHDIINKTKQLEAELKEMLFILNDINYSEEHKIKVTKERIQRILSE